MNSPLVLDEYLLNIKSESTRRAYKADIAQFLEFMAVCFEDIKRIDKVRTLHANNFIEVLKNQKFATNTINRKLASNLNFFEFLISTNRIIKNPWSSIERLDDCINNTIPTVSSNDVKKLLEAIDGHEEVSLLHQAILFTFFSTGIKKGELIKLKLEDFCKVNTDYYLNVNNRNNKLIKITLLGKCGSKIEQYLDEMVLLKSELEPSSWLFKPSRNPKDKSNLNKQLNPKSIDYIIKTWCNRAGLGVDISTHSARKFRIENEIEQTSDQKSIREKFGIAEQTYYRHKLSSDLNLALRN